MSDENKTAIELAIETMGEICNEMAQRPETRYLMAAIMAKSALEKQMP